MRRDELKRFFEDMTLARLFELAAAEQYAKGNIAGFLHLYPGEEAVAVGTLHASDPGDYVVSTYREHVHALVRGISPEAIMAELFGRSDGCSGGYGGSMHLFDAERRFVGGYAIVGETFPIALGFGYWVAMNRLPEAVICYFGDGAANQGTFHESLNMAALWKLPILFVCENNHYQIGTEIHRHSAVTEVYRRACGYGMDAETVDGMDVVAVHEETTRALRHVHAGNGPFLLECNTWRFRGHSMADPDSYRSAMEMEELRSRDPLLVLRERMLAQDWFNEAELSEMETDARKRVDEAVAFAAESPPPTELSANVYSRPLDLYGGGTP